ncbi:NAD(P)/FAD-dependent oxidoreductase [Scatolibacter rhodanostii]|uniref:NAD(P)/FAD-dependent oxidoreductase n=1 Tax=Scatolibacter rhodanostii TaxID=2014781 RepID=UPI000C075984|nr:NAD(P)/FAD-dependent oxidoreductase [Scatolibacter rhodanostii]
MKNEYDAIIIGAGPAGLMAAGTCAAQGKSVLMIEKNAKTGRKLRITGKGRCNVTNDCSPQEVIASVPKNGKFLFSALNQFDSSETMHFFENLGVKLKVERGRRVFPVSDSANEVADALEKFAQQNGVEIHRDTVQSLRVENGAIVGVKTQSGVVKAKSVLIACGGASYPGTGSNGDGAKLAKAVGHTIEPLKPSLIPLVEKGDTCAKLQGLSLKNSGVKVIDQEKKKVIYEDFGELLFTHFGLSGPTILSASAHMRQMASGRYAVEIDLKPALDDKKLDERILRDFEETKNKQFMNSLEKLLPQKLIPVIVEKSGIDPEKRCHSVTREERLALGHLLKHFTVQVQSFRPLNEAIVTSGGVSVKEISPKTMESKLIAGLFFAGEVMDVDAYTGGFNLQIAFATGHLAGSYL